MPEPELRKSFFVPVFLFTMLLAGNCHPEPPVPAAPGTCTYDVYNWNTLKKRAVNFARVRRPYSEIKAEEIDPYTGCTVCEEDQELVAVVGVKPFLICRKLVPVVRETLLKLLVAGEPVFEVEGYRPGRTKNPLDRSGNRLGFSNHAYGAAIDLNRSRNGLYDNCFKFGPGCRLLQGGRWKPEIRGTLAPGSAIVIAMKAAGFKWGGEIEGRQKDFMHFSFSGY